MITPDNFIHIRPDPNINLFQATNHLYSNHPQVVPNRGDAVETFFPPSFVRSPDGGWAFCYASNYLSGRDVGYVLADFLSRRSELETHLVIDTAAIEFIARQTGCICQGAFNSIVFWRQSGDWAMKIAKTPRGLRYSFVRAYGPYKAELIKILS